MAAGVTWGLVVAGCSLESPELPRYDADWLIPLGNVDYTVEELLDDEEGFVVGDDKSLSLHVRGALDPVAVGDQLEIEIAGRTVDASLGSFDLDPTDPVGFAFTLGGMYPPFAGVSGLSAPVPPFTFDQTSPAEDVPNIVSAQVSSGGIDLTVDNGLPVDLGGNAPPEQLTLDLIDPATSSVLTSHVFADAIGAGQSTTAFLDLAGVTVPDDVMVRLRGGSPGSGGSPVPVDGSDSVALQASTTALSVQFAEAVMGFHEFSESTTVDLPDSVQVVDATIARGVIDYDVVNDLPLPVVATVAIEPVFDATGQPLQFDVPVDASGVVRSTFDLAGYTVDFGARPGDALFIGVTVSTPGSGGVPVVVQSGDQVHAHVEPLVMGFAQVRGILDPQVVELPSTEAEIALPNDTEGLELLVGELVIDLSSNIGLPAMLDLDLQGFDEQQNMVPLSVRLPLDAAPVGETVVHRIVLNETNSDIIPFMNNLPKRVVARAVARIGDGVTVGDVSIDDEVSATYEVKAPMVVRVLPQVKEIDPVIVDLDQNLRDDINERVRAVRLEATVSNTLPLDATAWVGFDLDEGQLYTTPTVRLGPIEVPRSVAARTGGQLATAQAYAEVEVAPAEIPYLTQPGLRMAVTIDIPGSNGTYVTIRADDLLRVRGYLRATVRMGDLDQ